MQIQLSWDLLMRIAFHLPWMVLLLVTTSSTLYWDFVTSVGFVILLLDAIQIQTDVALLRHLLWLAQETRQHWSRWFKTDLAQQCQCGWGTCLCDILPWNASGCQHRPSWWWTNCNCDSRSCCVLYIVQTQVKSIFWWFEMHSTFLLWTLTCCHHS